MVCTVWGDGGGAGSSSDSSFSCSVMLDWDGSEDAVAVTVVALLGRQTPDAGRWFVFIGALQHNGDRTHLFSAALRGCSRSGLRARRKRGLLGSADFGRANDFFATAAEQVPGDVPESLVFNGGLEFLKILLTFQGPNISEKAFFQSFLELKLKEEEGLDCNFLEKCFQRV